MVRSGTRSATYRSPRLGALPEATLGSCLLQERTAASLAGSERPHDALSLRNCVRHFTGARTALCGALPMQCQQSRGGRARLGAVVGEESAKQMKSCNAPTKFGVKAPLGWRARASHRPRADVGAVAAAVVDHIGVSIVASRRALQGNKLKADSGRRATRATRDGRRTTRDRRRATHDG